MGAFERVRQRLSGLLGAPAPDEQEVALPVEAEDALRTLAQEDPNDVEAFRRLAETVRRRAAEGRVEVDASRAADDAVWALAEELAHSPKAWYPLVEMARLSIRDDREAAMRRLATATDRDPSGTALATSLRMLRREGFPAEALSLGVGHWRPHEHEPQAGRHVVAAAVEAGRHGEARRHLDALGLHPDTGAVARLREDLERLIAEAERARPARLREFERTGEMPRIVVDVRDDESSPRP